MAAILVSRRHGECNESFVDRLCGFDVFMNIACDPPS